MKDPSAPEQSSKNGKELLLYLARSILFGPVFEASLNSWTQVYRLNSLLPLTGNPKSFLTFSVFTAVTKFWVPYGSLASRTGITTTHILAGGSIQTEIARYSCREECVPSFLNMTDSLSIFSETHPTDIIQTITSKTKPTFPGQVYGEVYQRPSTNATNWSHILDPVWSGFRPGHVTGG